MVLNVNFKVVQFVKVCPYEIIQCYNIVTSSLYSDSAWIGLYDGFNGSNIDRRWEWENGQPFNWSFWFRSYLNKVPHGYSHGNIYDVSLDQ